MNDCQPLTLLFCVNGLASFYLINTKKMNYLKYKDEKIPVVVDFRALKKFQASTNVQYNDIEKIMNDPTLLEELFYFSLVSGTKSEGYEIKIKKEECEDILNENFSEYIKILFNDVVKLFNPNFEENQPKKK